MKKVLIFSAVAEAATGLALLIAPSVVGQLSLGEQLTGIAIPVARVAESHWLLWGSRAGPGHRWWACWSTAHVVCGCYRKSNRAYSISLDNSLALALGCPLLALSRLASCTAHVRLEVKQTSVVARLWPL